MIIPCIDIVGGKAVQLVNGKRKVIEEDIDKVIDELKIYPLVNVVDIDAAKGTGDNIELVRKICRKLNCNVGGGIRDAERARLLLRSGAKKLMIGSKADPDFLSNFPKERVICAIDLKGDKVMSDGWTRSDGEDVFRKIKDVDDYCSEYIYTDTLKEGMMAGINSEMVLRIKDATEKKINYAGGISTMEDILFLESVGVNSVVGMGFYSGKMDIVSSFSGILRFDDLIPTVVQDTGGQVLMVAFSSRDSFEKTLRERKGVYYSRSRKELWRKGDTSGNYQQLVRFSYDCDKDALLFIVEQKNFACHTGTYSCFGDKEFNLDSLYSIVKERFENPVEGSYTSSLNEQKIKKKILEEAREVVKYTDRDNLVWELGDLMYFMICLMAKKGVIMQEVRDELNSRRK
jgi:phosphoribosyl-ATP pyrophosphohydrolase